jgi:hypothetical protein
MAQVRPSPRAPHPPRRESLQRHATDPPRGAPADADPPESGEGCRIQRERSPTRALDSGRRCSRIGCSEQQEKCGECARHADRLPHFAREAAWRSAAQ